MPNKRVNALYVYDIFAYVLWEFGITIEEMKDWTYIPREDISQVQKEIGDMIITYQVLTRNLFRKYFARHSSWVRCSADMACMGMLEDLKTVGLSLLDGFNRTFCGAALVMELYLYLRNEQLSYLVSPADAFGDLLREVLTKPLKEEILDPHGNFKCGLNERISEVIELFQQLLPLRLNLEDPYDAFDANFILGLNFPLYRDLQKNLSIALYLSSDLEEEEPRRPVPFRWGRSSTQ